MTIWMLNRKQWSYGNYNTPDLDEAVEAEFGYFTTLEVAQACCITQNASTEAIYYRYVARTKDENEKDQHAYEFHKENVAILRAAGRNAPEPEKPHPSVPLEYEDWLRRNEMSWYEPLEIGCTAWKDV